MTRLGRNPMKMIKSVFCPERITATTIVHIPFLDGYWEESLEVLKVCLQSMRENARVPFDLMVFDNGSCVEVQDYLLSLQRQGSIQYLFLSGRNLGKAGAWSFLFSSAPGEIIAYTDSDVYFLPGWLETSLKILEVFPEVGMLTAQPIVGGDLSQSQTVRAAQKDHSVSIQMGYLIPDEYLIAQLKALNAPFEEYQRRQKDRKDVMLSRKGVSAYAGASHFQFLITKKAIQALTPFKITVPLGNDLVEFDKKIHKAVFWKLSTIDYLAHHMGNKISDLQTELSWRSKGPALKPKLDQYRLAPNSSGLLRNQFVRRILKQINILSYKFLYYK